MSCYVSGAAWSQSWKDTLEDDVQSNSAGHPSSTRSAVSLPSSPTLTSRTSCDSTFEALTTLPAQASPTSQAKNQTLSWADEMFEQEHGELVECVNPGWTLIANLCAPSPASGHGPIPLSRPASGEVPTEAPQCAVPELESVLAEARTPLSVTLQAVPFQPHPGRNAPVADQTDAGSAADVCVRTPLRLTPQTRAFSVKPCRASGPAAGECTDIVRALYDQIPRDEGGQVTSLGSIHHGMGRCYPCLLWYHSTCPKGVNCTYCHLPHRGQEVKKRIRRCKKEREAQKADRTNQWQGQSEWQGWSQSYQPAASWTYAPPAGVSNYQ